MRKLALSVPFVLLLAACGSDSKSCTSTGAEVATSGGGQPLVGSCSVAAGTTVNIPVGLCRHCGQSSPGCNADFRDGVFDINPVIFECAEDRVNCLPNNSCDPTPATTTCNIAVPAGTPAGPYDVILASTATKVGTVTVGSGSGCTSF